MHTKINVLEFIPPVNETDMTREREEKKVSPEELVKKMLPQLRKERKIITMPKMRFFIWMAFFFPSLAYKILSKP